MRDLRDPQALGEWLLDQRMSPFRTVREKYDSMIVTRDHICQVSKDDSMVKITVAEYRKELEEREDVYAKSALASIDAGQGVQGYDSAGA